MANVGKFTRRGKDLSGVMANSGFGDLTIHKSGITVHIPKELLNSSTEYAVSKNIQAKLDELTRENIEYLESKGVVVELGLKNLANF